MRNDKRVAILAVLAISLLLLTACKQNPSEEQLFSKLRQHFEDRGYTFELMPLTEAEVQPKVAIYDASVWTLCSLGEEELLIYFDDSNRADYLGGLIDQEEYGYIGTYGLRFIVNYRGEDAGVIEALDAMPS